MKVIGDVNKLPDQDLEILRAQVELVQQTRRQYKRREFLKKNPPIGYSLHNEGAWKHFWADFADVDYGIIHKELVDGYRLKLVRNPELAVQLKSDPDIVYFNPARNTSTGEFSDIAEKM